MLVAPASGVPTPKILSTMAPDLTGIAGLTGSVAGSVVWPSANLGLYYPVRVEQTRTYTKAWWLNGTVVAGNVDVGIFTIAGTTATLIGASTAVAQAGVSALQVAATFGPITLNPGLYYLAMSCSLATATVWRAQPAAAVLKSAGIFQRAAAHALSANGAGTVAVIAQGLIPVFGFAEDSVI